MNADIAELRDTAAADGDIIAALGADLYAQARAAIKAQRMIANPLQRLAGYGELQRDWSKAATDDRDGRDALVYLGHDLFSAGRPTGCLVKGCAEPHKAFGLCFNHYRQWRGGKPWDKGTKARPGLGLAKEPAESDRAWRKPALVLSKITNYVFQRSLERRVHPSDEAGQPLEGFWRTRGHGDAPYRLPDPQRFATAEEHWAEAGRLNRRAKAYDALLEMLRPGRNQTLEACFPLEPDNKVLAELAGIQVDMVGKLRREWRGHQAA